MKPKLLLIDKDSSFVSRFQDVFQDEFEILHFHNFQSIQDKSNLKVDLLLLDEDSFNLEEDFLALETRFQCPSLLLLVEHDSSKLLKAIRDSRYGIHEFMNKPSSQNLESLQRKVHIMLSMEELSYLERLSSLMDVFYEFTHFRTIDELLEFMTFSISRILNAKRSTLFLYDRSSQELYSLVAEGEKQIRFSVSQGIAGAVARNKETVLIEDAYNDERFNTEIDKVTGFKTDSILAMPMINVAGKVVGVLQALNKQDGKVPFDEDDVKICSVFCSHAAMSIESKMLMEALQLSLESNQKYTQSIVDTINLGLVAIDSSKIIHSVNPGFQQLFNAEGALGANLTRFLDIEKVNHMIDEVENDQKSRQIEFCLDSSQYSRWFHIQARYLRMGEVEQAFALGQNDEELASILLVIEDITDRKQLLVDLENNLIALQEARDQLVQAEKLSALGKLAAGVAHEMNNPLSAVLTYANLLETKIKKLPPEIQEHLTGFDDRLSKMQFAAQRCKDIADNLLSFSRESSESKTKVQLIHCLNSTLELIHTSLVEKQIHLRLQIPENLPPLFGNSSQLQQVFTNLILNSIQAMEAGGSIEIQAIHKPGEEMCSILVKDSGPGVPEHIQSKIFDPFFTTKGLSQGTGLGLSITYGIVQDHGGFINLLESDCDSTETGASFLIQLPFFDEE